MKRDLFEATDELARELLRLIDLPLFDRSHRLAVSDVACSMSLEHWAATRSLLKIGLLPSAVVVHRAQFESLLRSLWIRYIASESWTDRAGQLPAVEQINMEIPNEVRNP